MKIFTIIFIFAVTLFATKLTKSTHYVIDDTNKLMWQDTMDNVKVRTTHEDAIKYCEKLSQSGFHDWRLPSVVEYKFIIDKSRTKEEIMLNRAFKYVLRDDYWIQDRTWVRNFGLYSYYVIIKTGAIYYQNRTYKKFVRCIRDIK